MRANVISRKQGLATLWVHAGCRPFVECRVARALKARAGDTQVGGRQRERAKREGGTGDTPPDLVTPNHEVVPDAGSAALERAYEHDPAVWELVHFCVYLARTHIRGRRAERGARVEKA